MSQTARKPEQRDGGFTMIEMLIVITTMAILIGTLSAVFLVIIKTSPSSEIRVDDARSTRGLATWLSHDTTSAPPNRSFDSKGWIDTSSGGACGGPGVSLVQFSWLEEGFSSQTFYADYRFVADGGDASVVRYFCSTSGASTTMNLTAGLDPLTPPDIALNPSTGDVDSVDFTLHSNAGDDVLIETGSRNPVEFYP